MAHFAKINEQNIVEEVVVVDDSQEFRGEDYLNEIGLEGRWVQTSYNSNIRGKFAGAGDTYNEELDRFEPAQPFPSWVWDENTQDWNAPSPRPQDSPEVGVHQWDEETTSWIVVKKQ